MMLKSFMYITLLLIVISCNTGVPRTFTEVDMTPPLFPDISGAEIPVTIAPLNFRFADPSGKLVVLFNGRNNSLSVSGRGRIIIPPRKWEKLMEGSRDDSISVILFSKQKRVWLKYRPFYIHVKSPGDQVLVYNFNSPANGSHNRYVLHGTAFPVK
jgi:hypothetical protein